MKMMKRRGEVSSWSPFTELNRLKGEINRILDSRSWPTLSNFGENWLPSLDVYQDKDKVTVQAELPGFKKEDINVSIDGDVLTISGERKHEQESPGTEPYRAERFYGRFEREVTLPSEVDPEKANASYKDGVLCIYLPKTEQSKRKQIEVQAS